MSEILALIKMPQLRPGDENCENFAFEVLPHSSPSGKSCEVGPIVIYANDLKEELCGIGTWTCLCGKAATVSVPLNSELD